LPTQVQKANHTLLRWEDSNGNVFNPNTVMDMGHVTYTAVWSFDSSSMHTLTGLVSSFNELHETEVRLIPEGSDYTWYDTPFRTTIEALDSSTGVRQTRSFFIHVPEGVYTLIAKKPAHTTFTVRGLEINANVDTSSWELWNHHGHGYGVMFLYAGDVTGNGFIGLEDVSKVNSITFYRKSVESFASGTDDRRIAELLNISGSGFIGLSDVAIIGSPENYRRRNFLIEL